MRTFLLALSLTVALTVAWPSDASAQTPKAAAQTVVSDDALQLKIQDKLSKAKAGGGKFQVKVKNGTAYLSGRADVTQHKGAATRMAKAAGAKRVVNNITISEAAKQRASRDSEQSRARPATVKSSS